MLLRWPSEGLRDASHVHTERDVLLTDSSHDHMKRTQTQTELRTVNSVWNINLTDLTSQTSNNQ